MNFSQNLLLTCLFSITILSSNSVKADDDLSDLQIEAEIVSADTVFDLDQAHKAREALQEKRKTYKNEIPRLREEIRQSYVTQQRAQKQMQSHEQEARRLENERSHAQSELNKMIVKTQKVDRLLKSAQGHLERKQKARDVVVEKRNAAIQRMNQRIDASELLVSKVEQAERDLKTMEAQYKKTLNSEREQKVALSKKQTNLKKRIAEAEVKTTRVKSMMKKISLGRAG